MTQQSWEQMLAEQKEKQRIKEEKLGQLIQNGGLKEWADRLTAEGRELKMTWDGGGDSGWVDFLIDDSAAETEQDIEYSELLRDMCYSELDYGSWAGEFSAAGECIYNPTSASFEGTDYYSEDDTVTGPCEIRIALPKDIWFDSIEIMIQDEEITADVDLIVRNGFKTEAHTEAEKALATSLEEQVNAAINPILGDREFRSMWEEINLSKSDFTIEGDEQVHILKELSVGTSLDEDRVISITLTNED